MPSRSTNLKSTIIAPLFSASFNASAGVMYVPLLLFVGCGAPKLLRPLERVLAALAGPDADRFIERRDEDLPVTDAPGARHRHDRLHDVTHDVVLDDDLDADLGDEVDHVGRAPVDLLLPARPP